MATCSMRHTSRTGALLKTPVLSSFEFIFDELNVVVGY